MSDDQTQPAPGTPNPGWIAPGTPPPAPQPPGYAAPQAPHYPPQPPQAQGYPTMPPAQYGPPGGIPGYPAAGQPPAYGGAWLPTVMTPGIVPLRPLGVGDIISGAFAAVRRNPKGQIPISLAVSVAFAVLQAGLLWVLYGRVRESINTSSTLDTGLLSGIVGVSLILTLLSLVLDSLVTGTLAYATGEGVLGRWPGPGEVWRFTKQHLWRLILLQLIIFGVVFVVVGVVVVVALAVGPAVALLLIPLVPLGIFAGIKVLFAPSALVLERLSAPAAIRRSWNLTNQRWWRTFGLVLLIGLIMGVVSSVLGLIAQTLVGVASGSLAGSGATDPNGLLLDTLSVASIASSTLQTVFAGIARPITAACYTLAYTDARIHDEGFDLVLAQAASAPQSPTRP